LNATNGSASVMEPYSVYIHKVKSTRMKPEQVMNQFLASTSAEQGNDEHAYRFWLDEATANENKTATSLLGCSKRRVEYWGLEKEASLQGLHEWQADGSYSHESETDILAYLRQHHKTTNQHVHLVSWDEGNTTDTCEILTMDEQESIDKVPFSFRGGHVGYLGYEVRHVTERFLAEQEHGRMKEHVSRESDPKIPTAAFLFCDRTFIYDHATQEWYLVGVVDNHPVGDTNGKDEASTLSWIRSTSERMAKYEEATVNGQSSSDSWEGNPGSSIAFVPNRSRKRYNQNFEQCLEHIRNGESYELCLTNQLEANVKAPGSNPLELYQVLRNHNPAPFSAFFDWNGKATTTETGSAVAICCSSPERFISVVPVKADPVAEKATKFEVEAKPIKGTCARALPENCQDLLDAGEDLETIDRDRAFELQSSVKNRAENLMIVDLLRNDLSRVCDVGSVHVSKLMAIESYATVHQMVSTIRGTLNVNDTAASNDCTVDVLMTCFPGGSMTGAPKVRTMELLDDLEEGVSRGPYSGALGYVSLNGAIDMNKVIRTAVLTPSDDGRGQGNVDDWNVSIGAGGAITALSESNDEYEEMILKASAVMKAVQAWSASCISSPQDGA